MYGICIHTSSLCQFDIAFYIFSIYNMANLCNLITLLYPFSLIIRTSNASQYNISTRTDSERSDAYISILYS